MESRYLGHELFAGPERPSEMELLTHATVPLLKALRWPPMQIAIGWKYTDIALFSEVRREAANCRVLVEGKRLNNGLLWAVDQVAGYATKVGPQVDNNGAKHR